MVVKHALGLLLAVSTACNLAQGQDALPSSNPKVRTVRQVYDHIVRAVGDGRVAPAIRVFPSGYHGSLRIAWYDPVSRSITLEERAYDICAGMGADSTNALALLLGHELAHFYKDHNWGGDFGNALADLDVGRTVGRIGARPEEVVRMESQADDFGGFFGYLAGYNTLGVASHVLSTLYEQYSISPNIIGYPSLPDRIAIAQRSESRLHAMLPSFNAGSLLLALQQFESAALIFDQIAKDFPSREILNDAGVARALAALSMFPRDSLKFIYPIEFDASSRLQHSSTRGEVEPDTTRRTNLLKEALEEFEAAKQRDPEYLPAQINYAIVTAILGDPDLSVPMLTKVLERSRQEKEDLSTANALVARGIAFAMMGESGKARKDFEDASAYGSQISARNLATLDGADPGHVQKSHEKTSFKTEQISGWVPGKYSLIKASEILRCFPQPDCESSDYIDGTVAREGRILVKASDTFEAVSLEFNPRRIRAIMTGRDYRETSARGIAIGDPVSKVRDRYGEPAYTVSQARCTSLVYADSHIAFSVAGSGVVTGWFVYDLE